MEPRYRRDSRRVGRHRRGNLSTRHGGGNLRQPDHTKRRGIRGRAGAVHGDDHGARRGASGVHGLGTRQRALWWRARRRLGRLVPPDPAGPGHDPVVVKQLKAPTPVRVLSTLLKHGANEGYGPCGLASACVMAQGRDLVSAVPLSRGRTLLAPRSRRCPYGRAAGAARQRRRRQAEGHGTSRGMTPILVSKVRGLQATQEASAPCQADLRGASTVGNATSRQCTRSARGRDLRRRSRQVFNRPRHRAALRS